MRARLSLVGAIAVTALAVGVPAALANHDLDGASKPVDAVSYFRANELATAAASGAISEPYAVERPSAASVQASTSTAEESESTGQPSKPTVEHSGSSIAWGQIALAFGVGLVLAIGLMTAVRFRPNRPIAQ
jgi:hypothetical protein